MRRRAFLAFLVVLAALLALAIATIEHRRSGRTIFDPPPVHIYNEP